MNRFAMRFTDYASDETCRRNIIYSLLDGMAYTVMVGLTTPFLGVYAVKLGATDFMLGLLSSLPALVAVLSQLPAAFITNSNSQRLPVVLRAAFFHRLGYLLFALIPFLPGEIRAWTFVLLLAAINFPSVVAGVAWTTMMGEIFSKDIRGRVFGDRNMILAWITMLSTLAAGRWLDLWKFPFNFQSLFVVAFAFLMLSLHLLSKLQENKEVSRAKANSFKNFAAVFRHKPFVGFMVSIFIMQLGFSVSAAMWTILYVRILGLSNSWIGAFSIISQAASALSYRWWGRFADRSGNLKVLLISMLLFMPQPVLYGFARGLIAPWVILVLSAISGFAGAGFSLTSFNALLEISPEEERPGYIAVYNTINSLPGFLLPLVGVAIYQASSIITVFAIASLIRLIAVALLWRNVNSTPYEAVLE